MGAGGSTLLHPPRPPVLYRSTWSQGHPATMGGPLVRAGVPRSAGARPSAASRERKQARAAPSPACRRGGAGSWNKSQEGPPGSSWSGLQRMEPGRGREKAGGERAGAFSGLGPAPAVQRVLLAPGSVGAPDRHGDGWAWRRCRGLSRQNLGGTHSCRGHPGVCGFMGSPPALSHASVSGSVASCGAHPIAAAFRGTKPKPEPPPNASVPAGELSSTLQSPAPGAGCCHGAGTLPSPCPHRPHGAGSPSVRPCPVWSRRCRGGGHGRGL